MSKELGIIVPFIGETDYRLNFLENLADVLIRNSISSRVVVIADSDGAHLPAELYQNLESSKLLDLHAITLRENTGYGRLIRIASAHLNTQYALIAFPDGSAQIELIPKMLNEVRLDANLVLINRFSNGKKNFAYVLQLVFRTFTRLLTGVKLPEDSTYGFRMYEKAVFDALAVSGTRWDFFAEQTLKFCLANANIKIIKGEYRASTARSVKLHFIKDGFGYIRVIIRTALHRLGLKWY
jgi:GT2 family glycosyltransferase